MSKVAPLTEQLIEIASIEDKDLKLKQSEERLRRKLTEKVLRDNPW